MRGLRVVTIGKVVFVVQCVAAAAILVVAGYAFQVVGLTVALGDGASLGSSAPSRSAAVPLLAR